jgi:carboxymethylenebutenolidase
MAVTCSGRCGGAVSTVGIEWPRISVRDVLIRNADDIMPAYVARPRHGDSWPTLLLIHEVFGIDRYIRDVAHRLASQGYFVVVPDLFIRQGDPKMFDSEQELRTRLAARVPDAQVLDDLDAAVTWAASNGGDSSRLGVTGFCWGGRIAWLYSARQSRLKAAVAWYGRIDGERNEITPLHPIDIADQLGAPVLGLYGGQDKPVALEATQRFHAALVGARSASVVYEYPGIPHAFHAHYRGTFREDAAEDGWMRMLSWFRHHGVAAEPVEQTPARP